MYIGEKGINTVVVHLNGGILGHFAKHTNLGGLRLDWLLSRDERIEAGLSIAASSEDEILDDGQSLGESVDEEGYEDGQSFADEGFEAGQSLHESSDIEVEIKHSAKIKRALTNSMAVDFCKKECDQAYADFMQLFKVDKAQRMNCDESDYDL